MSHLMIDIETLATDEAATILTIGAQGFVPETDAYTDVTYYKRLTLESQEDRSVDDSTVMWWGKQSADAQDEALGDGDDRVDITTALTELSKIAFKHKFIWANGTLFDIVILENAMRQYGVSIPWKYWQVQDARTVYKLTPKVGKLGNNHNALADCCNQIDMLQKSFKILGLSDD